jgi:iron complex transport system substrate-binding protein
MSRWPLAGSARGLLAVLTVALAVAGCGPSAESAGPSGTNTGFPRTVTHAMGRTTIDRPPQRVAALDTSFVDAAIALRTPVVAYTRYPGLGDRLPGYLGPDAATYTRDAQPVGDLANPSIERIAAQNPDLIVSAKVRHEQIYDKLAGIAPTVFTETTGATWKDNVRLLARALGKEQLAEQEITAYQTRARRIGDEIRAREGRNPTVSIVRFVGGEQTVRLYTPNSFPGIVLADTGLARPAGQPTGQQISVNLSQEQITALDADRIFVASYADGRGESAAVRQRFEVNPLWGRLRGQVSDVDDTTWIASVSLQGAGAMLDDLARAFGVDPARNG